MDPGILMENGILLIHPPAAKACEAPGGPARLMGALQRYGVACRVWDANLEGQLRLMEGGRSGAEDVTETWTRRAAKHLAENLAALRSREFYRNPDRYRRAVMDMNRLLAAAARPYGVRLSLADYEDERLSPVRSVDLLQAAAAPEANPFYPWFRGRLPEILTETPVSHVGFSLNYLSQALTTFAMIGFLRRAFPEVRIVLGGGLVTSWIRRPDRKTPFADLVDELIAGTGEAPLLALLGKEHDDGPDRPDLAVFPWTDYLSPGTVLPYSASSGCWWRRCSFCPERAEGNAYRPLPPAQVTADLRALVAETKPALIHLLDNALSPALLDALTAEPPGSPWYGFARVTPRLADPDFCLQMRDSGCVMLKLGLESGDPAVLDALNKGIDLPTVSAVLKNLKAAGIATYVYLLFGTPVETPAAARRTLAFTAEHAEEIGFLNLAIFNLPAYSPEAEEFDTGEFYAGDLFLYRPFSHPQGWNRGEVRRFLEREFKKHPAIASILRRDPPFFTSNHAPFFAMKP
ncbi:MAG: radical SAM protein [Deltaproteobacteria bacterium]|nr:radical SAM protein [Deltaproteobacteria bacterium]